MPQLILCPPPTRILPLNQGYTRLYPILLGSCKGISIERATTLMARAKVKSFSEEKIPSDYIRLSLNTQKQDLLPQAYELSIYPGNIELHTHSESGLFYGLITLAQIIVQSKESLPCIQVIDKPDIKERGFMLDISRNKVPTLESLKALIEQLAFLKINQLQLYIEHTFAFKDHEKVWEDASPLTPAEIRELDCYCQSRFIELIPNLNSLGHMGKWLQHEDYHHLAECPDGITLPSGRVFEHGTTLTPDDQSIRFMQELYNEFLPHFSSNKFNVGCDEPWELGHGRSAEDAKTYGKDHLYLNYLNKLHTLVKSHEKTMQFWADIILENPENVSRLNRPVLGMIWGYEAEHPLDEQCHIFNQTSVPFYVVPGTSTWNSLGGRLQNAYSNISKATKAAFKHGAQGVLLTDWGDNGHHQPFSITYLPLIAFSAQSWHVEAEVDESLIFNQHICQNAKSPLGNGLESLGFCANIFSKIHNKSAINELLFSTEISHTLKEHNITALQLQTALINIREVIEKLRSLKNPPNDLIRAEIILAARLMEIACIKGLYPRDKTRYQRDKAMILEDFKRIWLKRNRPGGLQDSLARLKEGI